MQSKHKITNKLMCLLLALVLIFSTLTTAFAGSSYSMTPGANSSGGRPVAGSTWSKQSQFMRISLYWAPRATDTSQADAWGLDWSSPLVKQIGKSFDWALGDGKNPLSAVVQHSNFTSAKDYFKNGYTFKMGRSFSYYGTSQVYNLGDGILKTGKPGTSDGTPLNFPRPVDKANNVDVKNFFQQPQVLNEVLYLLKLTVGLGNGGTTGVGAMQIELLTSGTYIDPDGNSLAGGYLLTVEPGVYSPLNGVFSAYTMRDALAWGKGTGKALNVSGATVAWAANSLNLEPNGIHPKLGLSYMAPLAVTNAIVKNESNYPTLYSTQGIGTAVFTSKEQGLPVLKYFYDVEADKGELDTDIGSTTYFVKADNIKEVNGVGSTYKAAPEEDGYTLIGATVLSKSEIQGHIYQIPATGGKSTVFKNAKDDTVRFSDEAINKLSTNYKTKEKIPNYFRKVVIVATSDVKSWAIAHSFVTDLSNATKVSEGEIKKLSDLMNYNADGSLNYFAGKGLNDLQLALLYVKGEFKPEDIPVPEVDTPTQIYKKGNTNVTKMFFDTPDSTTPTSKNSDSFGKEAVYNVKDDQPNYKMTEWVIVDDKTPNTPEPYPDWTTVKDNVSEAGKTGDKVGPLGPLNWNDPDRELFIRYEKITEPEKPAVDGELYIPERRISWKKSLSDIGGIPTINFSWPAITGEHLEYDGCGSEKHPCPGHTCTEHVEDGTLTSKDGNYIVIPRR